MYHKPPKKLPNSGQRFNLDLATAGADNFLLVGDHNASSDVWGSSNTIAGCYLLDK